MTRPARIAFAAAALAGLYALSARAQFSYKTGIDVAGFTVTVVNRAGETIPDLKADDFEVREDGVPQSVTYFSDRRRRRRGAAPHRAAVRYQREHGAGTWRSRGTRRSSSSRRFPKAVDFTLVEFADDVRAARFSQAEFPRLVERIRSSKAKGRTSLYDAVTVYLGSAFDQTGRKVLVIFTDGDDTSSSRRWDETLRLLRASDVTVYPMGFLSNRGSGRLLLQSKLMEIARLTGGRAVFPGSMKELDPMYAAIAAEIQGQYVLGYVPTNVARDGKWRKVEIKLKRPASERLQLRTREGYFAPVK